MNEGVLFWFLICAALVSAGASMVLATDIHWEIKELKERRKERENLKRYKETERIEASEKEEHHKLGSNRTLQMYTIS